MGHRRTYSRGPSSATLLAAMVVRPILIVEDHVEFATFIAREMECAELSPILAHSGAQALRCVQQAPPAAILLDLLLPDMTGHRFIRELSQAGVGTPPFIMTALFLDESHRKTILALSNEISGWHEKPLDVRALISQIKRCVDTGSTSDFDVHILEPTDDRSGKQTHSERSASDRGSGSGLNRLSLTEELRHPTQSKTLHPATLIRLLTAFHVTGTSGHITVTGDDVTKVIYFRQGHPVFAQSTASSDLVQSLAKATRPLSLSSQQLDAAVQLAERHTLAPATILFQQQLIDEHFKADLLRAQTRTIIKSLIPWTEGTYSLSFEKDNLTDYAELEDSPATMILASIRELFDLDRLRTLVPNRLQPMPASDPVYELWDMGLGDAEAMLLLRATGIRSIRTLLKDIAPRMSEKDGRALLHGLLSIGFLVTATLR